MKKLFLILGIAGFIACNSLIGGSDDTTSGGYQVIGTGYFCAKDGYDGATLYICIKNTSGADLHLKTCTFKLYKNETTTIEKTISIPTIKAGRSCFIRCVDYNSNYDFSYSIKE
jgi:hypothetical protein